MTIREIAALAGVSVSTVSKILNKKDEHLSAETRERVLKLVREYPVSYTHLTQREVKVYFDQIAKSFAEIPVKKTEKIKVGVVGEIYVKYSPLANNDLENFLFEQGCEAVSYTHLDVYKRQGLMIPILSSRS